MWFTQGKGKPGKPILLSPTSCLAFIHVPDVSARMLVSSLCHRIGAGGRQNLCPPLRFMHPISSLRTLPDIHICFLTLQKDNLRFLSSSVHLNGFKIPSSFYVNLTSLFAALLTGDVCFSCEPWGSWCRVGLRGRPLKSKLLLFLGCTTHRDTYTEMGEG